jgi:hypothetical protein
MFSYEIWGSKLFRKITRCHRSGDLDMQHQLRENLKTHIHLNELQCSQKPNHVKMLFRVMALLVRI